MRFLLSASVALNRFIAERSWIPRPEMKKEIYSNLFHAEKVAKEVKLAVPWFPIRHIRGDLLLLLCPPSNLCVILRVLIHHKYSGIIALSFFGQQEEDFLTVHWCQWFLLLYLPRNWACDFIPFFRCKTRTVSWEYRALTRSVVTLLLSVPVHRSSEWVPL